MSWSESDDNLEPSPLQQHNDVICRMWSFADKHQFFTSCKRAICCKVRSESQSERGSCEREAQCIGKLLNRKTSSYPIYFNISSKKSWSYMSEMKRSSHTPMSSAPVCLSISFGREDGPPQEPQQLTQHDACLALASLRHSVSSAREQPKKLCGEKPLRLRLGRCVRVHTQESLERRNFKQKIIISFSYLKEYHQKIQK